MSNNETTEERRRARETAAGGPPDVPGARAESSAETVGIDPFAYVNTLQGQERGAVLRAVIKRLRSDKGKWGARGRGGEGDDAALRAFASEHPRTMLTALESAVQGRINYHSTELIKDDGDEESADEAKEGRSAMPHEEPRVLRDLIAAKQAISGALERLGGKRRSESPDSDERSMPGTPGGYVRLEEETIVGAAVSGGHDAETKQEIVLPGTDTAQQREGVAPETPASVCSPEDIKAEIHKLEEQHAALVEQLEGNPTNTEIRKEKDMVERKLEELHRQLETVEQSDKSAVVGASDSVEFDPKFLWAQMAGTLNRARVLLRKAEEALRKEDLELYEKNRSTALDGLQQLSDAYHLDTIDESDSYVRSIMEKWRKEEEEISDWGGDLDKRWRDIKKRNDVATKKEQIAQERPVAVDLEEKEPADIDSAEKLVKELVAEGMEEGEALVAAHNLLEEQRVRLNIELRDLEQRLVNPMLIGGERSKAESRKNELREKIAACKEEIAWVRNEQQDTSDAAFDAAFGVKGVEENAETATPTPEATPENWKTSEAAAALREIADRCEEETRVLSKDLRIALQSQEEKGGEGVRKRLREVEGWHATVVHILTNDGAIEEGHAEQVEQTTKELAAYASEKRASRTGMAPDDEEEQKIAAAEKGWRVLYELLAKHNLQKAEAAEKAAGIRHDAAGGVDALPKREAELPTAAEPTTPETADPEFRLAFEKACWQYLRNMDPDQAAEYSEELSPEGKVQAASSGRERGSGEKAGELPSAILKSLRERGELGEGAESLKEKMTLAVSVEYLKNRHNAHEAALRQKGLSDTEASQLKQRLAEAEAELAQAETDIAECKAWDASPEAGDLRFVWRHYDERTREKDTDPKDRDAEKAVEKAAVMDRVMASRGVLQGVDAELFKAIIEDYKKHADWLKKNYRDRRSDTTGRTLNMLQGIFERYEVVKKVALPLSEKKGEGTSVIAVTEEEKKALGEIRDAYEKGVGRGDAVGQWKLRVLRGAVDNNGVIQEEDIPILEEIAKAFEGSRRRALDAVLERARKRIDTAKKSPGAENAEQQSEVWESSHEREVLEDAVKRWRAILESRKQTRPDDLYKRLRDACGVVGGLIKRQGTVDEKDKGLVRGVLQNERNLLLGDGNEEEVGETVRVLESILRRYEEAKKAKEKPPQRPSLPDPVIAEVKSAPPAGEAAAEPPGAEAAAAAAAAGAGAGAAGPEVAPAVTTNVVETATELQQHIATGGEMSEGDKKKAEEAARALAESSPEADAAAKKAKEDAEALKRAAEKGEEPPKGVFRRVRALIRRGKEWGEKKKMAAALEKGNLKYFKMIVLALFILIAGIGIALTSIGEKRH